MLTAIVTIRLKSGDREMFSFNQSRGCYVLETEQAEYEVREGDDDTMHEFIQAATDQTEIQAFVLCDISDLSYDLSTEVGHNFDGKMVMDSLKVENIELAIGDTFIEQGEVEAHENDDLIASIITNLEDKIS